MALSEVRAKDLAQIDPPGSITKVVQFAEQLSFTQDALFSGTELPNPKFKVGSFETSKFAQDLVAKPYSFFPGVGSDGLDAVMSRYSVRTRDIQDFTRWLIKWDAKRTELLVVESPEQFFLNRATPQSIEAFEENPEVQRIVREGRRRRRVVREEVDGPETEEVRIERVARAKGISNARAAEEVAQSPRRGHPTPARGNDTSQYWKSAETGASDAATPPPPPAPSSVSIPPAFDSQLFVAGLNRGLMTANLGFGSLAGGLIRGRSDVMVSFQAQNAAVSAIHGSPVAPMAFAQPNYPPIMGTGYMPQPSMGGIPVTSDWSGSPGASPVMSVFGGEQVIVPKPLAESRGLYDFPPTQALYGGPSMGSAASWNAPSYPGVAGAASSNFAGQVAIRNATSGPAVIYADSGAGAMPAGSVPRKDVFVGGLVDGMAMQAIAGGMRSGEAPVRTQIPASPLLGQVTLVAAPLRVASPEAERSGTAISIDLKQISRGGGSLDANGLAMLKQALPPGAQAIYPALPIGSLGAQAVNLKLAPSLLGQILAHGYGPQAAASMLGPISSMSSAMAMGSTSTAPLQASIVPGKRPTDANAGILGMAGVGGAEALSQAGAGSSQRGGVLDFLGMPVRLAPSLAGNPDVKQAAEARKILPAGAAAVMRPKDFGTMRSQLFPSFGSVNAEPDKTQWQKAAPSFGLRDAEPQTLLAPDARIKPPTATQSLPQLSGPAQSPLGQALRSATVIPGAQLTTGGIGLKTPAHAIHPEIANPPHFRVPSMPAVRAQGLGLPSMGASLGAAATSAPVSFTRMPSGPSRPSSMPTPTIRLSQISTSMPASIGAGAAASGFGQAVQSRFTPMQPSIGGTPSMPSASPKSLGGSFAAMESPASEAHAVGHRRAPLGAPAEAKSTPSYRSPAPSMGSPASSSGSGRMSGFTRAAMTRPTIATTAAARTGSSSLASPGMPSASTGASSTRSATTTTTSSGGSGLAHRRPDMPIATSIAVKPPVGASATIVQRATAGGATHSGNYLPENNEVSNSRNESAIDPGAAAHEMNALATEVWSVLKRKLRFEAERLGKI